MTLRFYEHIEENETMNCLPEFSTAEIMPRQQFLTLASWSLGSRLSCRVARHRSVVTDPIRLLVGRLSPYLLQGVVRQSQVLIFTCLLKTKPSSRILLRWLILFCEVWIWTAMRVMEKQTFYTVARNFSFVLTWPHKVNISTLFRLIILACFLS